MKWPIRRRSTPKPSAAAQEHMESSEVELQEVRHLRVESQRIGAALARAQAENHIALALARAIGGRT